MAASKLSGNRMLSLADFLRYSNLTGFISDKSYSDKSAESKNASASSSLVRVGSFFDITVNLVLVHVSGTDWPNISRATVDAIRERYKYPSHGIKRSDGKISCLLARMSSIRVDAGI